MSQMVTVGELDTAAVGYLVHLQRKAQPNTVVSYRESIDKFLTYAGERGVRDFAGVTRVLVEGWQDYLAITPTRLTRKPLAPRSRNVAASAVRNVGRVERDDVAPPYPADPQRRIGVGARRQIGSHRVGREVWAESSRPGAVQLPRRNGSAGCRGPEGATGRLGTLHGHPEGRGTQDHE